MDRLALLGAVLAMAIAAGAAALVVPWLVAPRGRGDRTAMAYECGAEPVGPAWVRFPVAYVLLALVFVAFEVDVLYLFPVAVAFREVPTAALVEVGLFLGMLGLALAFAWRKGVLRWT